MENSWQLFRHEENNLKSSGLFQEHSYPWPPGGAVVNWDLDKERSGELVKTVVAAGR